LNPSLPQCRPQHDGIIAGARLHREQAYVICSVAVDLRISNVVDVPNYVVSALCRKQSSTATESARPDRTWR